MNNLNETLISLQGISVIKQNKTILDNISIHVCANEILTLIGPNGSGKSTLVKTALGLIKPNSGKVSISANTTIAYVPQSIQIDKTLPMSVLRFMQLHLHADKQKITAALQQTGAARLLNDSLHSLSGGEMRRVLLARAMVHQPNLLILDEPTAGVDITGQAELYALIQKLKDDTQCGILLVSHDLHIVMAATNRVVCLNHHVCCQGTPEKVSQAPEFAHLFGDKLSQELAVYHHQHDHEHNLDGQVCEHEHG